MKRIGAHVSASGGVANAPLNAQNIAADAFALFVKNQRQWSAKPLSQKDIDEFKSNLNKANIKPEHILAHNSYLVNLGHPDADARAKSFNSFLDEIRRCEALGIELINFHPGSHLKQISEDECLELIAQQMNNLLKNSSNIKLVIENTAGQGSNLGYKFEHLAALINMSQDSSRVGVCIDTCHLFASGYDIRDDESYAKTMSEFDRIVGYKYLSGMHINDSKCALGSRK
ncbi:deoxyribonuclease IV, partial [Campylobacter lanienae]